MKKHENFEENGLVWVTINDQLAFKMAKSLIGTSRYTEDGNVLYTNEKEDFEDTDEFLMKFSEWQKSTAKAIFELMPDMSIIEKSNLNRGYCVAKSNGYFDQVKLSIDLFPFSETGEIKREDVLTIASND